jgi:sRNA-binding regulator protein Hfq
VLQNGIQLGGEMRRVSKFAVTNLHRNTDGRFRIETKVMKL